MVLTYSSISTTPPPNAISMKRARRWRDRSAMRCARSNIGHGADLANPQNSLGLTSFLVSSPPIIAVACQARSLPPSLLDVNWDIEKVSVPGWVRYSSPNSRTALSLGAGGKHDLRRGDEQRLRVVLQGLNVGERGYGRARRLAPLLRLPLALYTGQLPSQAPESGECRRSEHCARLAQTQGGASARAFRLTVAADSLGTLA
jgi:hypothetical protein